MERTAIASLADRTIIIFAHFRNKVCLGSSWVLVGQNHLAGLAVCTQGSHS